MIFIFAFWAIQERTIPFRLAITIHKDLTERLEKIDRELWLRVKAVLETNKAERHIRGGAATRIKYKGNTE